MAREDFKPKKQGGGNMLLSPDTLRKLLETADRPEVEMDSSQFTKEVRGGKVHYRLREGEPVSPSGGGRAIPYRVHLITTGDTYEVTVGWGYVCERIPGAGDALVYHEAGNMWLEDDAGEIIEPRTLARFPITPGQAVYVKVNVTAEGTIGSPDESGSDAEDAVSIVIDADNASSTHYTPQVDDENTAGAAGFYLYKLAVLEATDPPALKKWLTGSHIDHYQDLPSIRTTLLPSAGIGCIIKEWSDSLRAYVLRALWEGLGRLNITTNADHIEIRGTKKDADLIVWNGDDEESTPLMEFRDGLSDTGAEVVGDEDPGVDPESLPIYIPTVIAGDGVTVEQVGLTGKIYKVTANHPWKVTANGDATVAVAAGSVLSWSDGVNLTMSRFKDYVGGTVTVTGNGFIYGRIAAALGLYPMASPTGTFTDTNGDEVVVDLFLNRVIVDSSDDIVVAFDTVIPESNSYFYFEIAQVSLAAGVAAVDFQTLHHNPPLWSFSEPP